MSPPTALYTHTAQQLCCSPSDAVSAAIVSAGSNAPAIYSRNMNSSVAAQPPSRREVTMCLDTGPAAPLAAGAPVNDNRCYVYGAVSGQVRCVAVCIVQAGATAVPVSRLLATQGWAHTNTPAAVSGHQLPPCKHRRCTVHCSISGSQHPVP